MSFLQPLLLAALPLMALPILIHLLNRHRHRTVPWGAMMFLLDARRQTRGLAHLRHWLIMAMRMLALGALIFAASRPLASGWLGLAVGGQAETTIILLDRSASMEQQDLQTAQSKRTTALHKLSQLLDTLGSSSRLVLVESTQPQAQEIESAGSLLELPQTAATDTSADIPAMLQAALDYVTANTSGRTDVWICSDLRDHDWQPDDGRWAAIRDGFGQLPGIRFYLLSYPEPAGENLSVSVANLRQRQAGGSAELVMDVHLRREGGTPAPLEVPLEVVINGARSAVPLTMTDREHVLQGHTVALDRGTSRGWGRVELPPDSNPRDNLFYFVFSEPPEHRTVIVSDDPRAAGPLQLAAASPPDPALSYTTTVLPTERVADLDWDAASLVLWHAPLPEGLVADQLQDFVASGRPVVCFPPEEDGGNELFGVRWEAWNGSSQQPPVNVASWRGDSDLLAHTPSGAVLPLGKLRTYRYRSILGPATVLARLDEGRPLLVRAAGDARAYFCATLPHAGYSSLAHDGVAFYVMIQRALAMGAEAQSDARQLVAGSPEARVAGSWEALSEAAAIASARPLQAGAFEKDGKLIALNRPLAEDTPGVLDHQALQTLLAGLDYQTIDDRLGDSSPLASEIWRAFLFVMAAALMLEAVLCLPQRKREGNPSERY